MRRLVLLALSTLLACGSRGARSTTESLIRDIDARDADGAVALTVSGDQLEQIISCATPGSASWLTAADRKTKTEALRTKYRSATIKHVQLGPMFEDYDRETQWHSYAVGDVVHGDCRAKAPFAIEVHRIVLVINDGFSSTPIESTKPIELWKIDGKYYAWDDPTDTEGWK